MKISFLGSLPNIQSAIKAGADGMRVQFDIPETEVAEAVKLVMCKQQVLKITIETEDNA